MTAEPASIDPIDLPEAISRYLSARAAKDVSAAASAFAPDAVVTDDAQTYQGAEAITRWIGQTDTEYSYTTTLVGYTTTLVGAERDTPDRYTVRQRLEGDFPGGMVELSYRFALTRGQISELSIAP